MANYQNLKAAISAAIRTNGNQEITGQVLQDVLNSIVSVIGANYTFAGVATPATNPGTPDQNVIYLAMEGGTYTNFNGTVLPAGISLLMWNGTWTSETVMYGDGGVFDISVYKSSGGTLATFADLAAALDGGNNIPVGARKGGMSVKFVQSSDNKYVQYRLMSDTFNTTPANWQGINNIPTSGSSDILSSDGIFNAIKTNLQPFTGGVIEHLYVDSSFVEHTNASWDAHYFLKENFGESNKIAFIVRYGSGNESNKACVLYDKDNNVLGSLSCGECSQNRLNYISVPKNCTNILILNKNTVGDATILSVPNINYNTPYKLEQNIIGSSVAIIGDSISTFNQEGYKYENYATKYPYSNVLIVQRCWWYNVLESSVAKLGVNLSYSGSGITPISDYPSLYDRASLIGTSDIVIIALGTNDSRAGVAIGDFSYDKAISELDGTKFAEGYIKGIKQIYATKANAKIICVALRMGDNYKRAIQDIAMHYGLLFVDASEYELANVTGETIHPSATGMNQIANAFFRADNRFKELNNLIDQQWQVPSSEYSTAYISSTGVKTSNNSWDCYQIDNKEQKIKTIRSICNASSAILSYKRIAFYSSLNVFDASTLISSVDFNEVAPGNILEIDVPEGCFTILLSNRKDNGSASFSVLYKETNELLFENIKTLRNERIDYYIKADGSLSGSPSWHAYIFRNPQFDKVLVQSFNSLTGSYALYKSVAFYSDAYEINSSTLIDSVDFATKASGVAFEKSVPTGTKAMVVAERFGDGNCLIYAKTDNIVKSLTNLEKTSTFCESNIVNEKFDSIGNAEFWLNGVGVHSDMTWVGDKLVGFDAQAGESQDPSTENAARIHVYTFPNGIKEAAVDKVLYHQFGHCNTVDYCAAIDCLILGNGSGSYTLTGDIIVIPNFSTLIDSAAESGFSLTSANALVIHCASDLGTKFNLVWGDDNDKNYNIAYLITANYGGSTSANGGDLETIRKIVLRKGEEQGAYGTIVENSTPFNGTFDIVETYNQITAGYANCDQGTCYRNGELFACIGHDGPWYWRMRLADGKVFRKNYKQQTYYANKPTNFGNASGICFKDGIMYVGRGSVGVMALDI